MQSMPSEIVCAGLVVIGFMGCMSGAHGTLALMGETAAELLEQNCLEDWQCAQYRETEMEMVAACVDGVCKCNNSAGKPIKCRPQNAKFSNIIGGHCPCQQPQAECKATEDTCYCMLEHVPSADRRRCIPKTVQLNGTCEEDIQCQATDSYAVCNMEQQRCQCKADHVLYQGVCVSTVGAASRSRPNCSEDAHCKRFGAAAICFTASRRCICTKNSITADNGTACIPIADYDEECVEHVQCERELGSGSACVGGLCKCDEKHFRQTKPHQDGEGGIFGHHAHGGVYNSVADGVMCARIIELGEYCHDSADCYQQQLKATEQTLACIAGECNCKWGYYSVNNTMCVNGNGGGGKQDANVAMVAVMTLLANAISNEHSIN